MTAREPSASDVEYRGYVGPSADYDVMAGLQFALLFALGLREQSSLLDVGCGSLRAGRLFIPFLGPGRYFGIEPNEWLVEAGIEQNVGASLVALKQPTFATTDDFDLSCFGTQFDFILAQSILSHTYGDLLDQALAGVPDALAPGGTFVGTFVWRSRALGLKTDLPRSGDGSGWLYPECVSFTWREMQQRLARHGLVGTPLPWRHPRQRWFASVKAADRPILGDHVRHSRSWLRAPSYAKLAAYRALHPFARGRGFGAKRA